MCLWVSYKKKNGIKIFVFCILKNHLRKESDPLVRGTDPRIRIRTKMSRIPNTASCLGRYVFGSEISYNKAPPRLPGLAC